VTHNRPLGIFTIDLPQLCCRTARDDVARSETREEARHGEFALNQHPVQDLRILDAESTIILRLEGRRGKGAEGRRKGGHRKQPAALEQDGRARTGRWRLVGAGTRAAIRSAEPSRPPLGPPSGPSSSPWDAPRRFNLGAAEMDAVRRAPSSPAAALKFDVIPSQQGSRGTAVVLQEKPLLSCLIWGLVSLPSDD
jgi:hypothetical protein